MNGTELSGQNVGMETQKVTNLLQSMIDSERFSAYTVKGDSSIAKRRYIKTNAAPPPSAVR